MVKLTAWCSSIALSVVAAAGIVLASSPAVAQATTQKMGVPGGEIVYDDTGRGPAVVLLHGAFMDRRSWDAQVEALARRFRVVRYDIRPFGESKLLDKAYSVPDDLLRLLDHLAIARAHLVGHSFGGGVAVDFALLYPERVASLTLVAAGVSGFNPPEDERKAAGAIFGAVKQGDDAVIAAWMNHPMWAVSRQRPEVAKAIEASTRRSLGAFTLTFAPYIPMKPPALQRLNEIRIPTLVVIGDRDTAGNREVSRLLAKGITGAVLVTVRGADHGLPLGWPDDFNAALLDFLSTAR